MKCLNPACNAVFTDDDEKLLVCPTCNGPLNIHIVHDQVGRLDLDAFFRSRTSNMWKFLPFLPLKDEKNIVTLGEGATPLLTSGNLIEDLGLHDQDLLLKNEAINPTGSFEDRQISMGISAAKELGYTRAICLSSGNVGAAVAAYSARAGFKSLVVVPRNYRSGKLMQIRMYGGNAIRIESDSDNAIMDMVLRASSTFNAINLATTSLYNPFTNHGAKTIIYELYEQNDLKLPDLLVVPVGGAGLLSALMQACLELRELELIADVPSFLAVQPEGCAPFIEAIRDNLDPATVYANPWKNITTEISALASDVPFDYDVFHFINSQFPAGKVIGITVADKEARDAQRLLSKKEGIFVEGASATTIAALRKLGNVSDDLAPFGSICAILTGTGLMDMDQATRKEDRPRTYPADSDIDRILKPYFN
jgi:threonine synthase